MRGVAQSAAVAAIGLKSLPRRPWSAGTTIFAIALVVLVLLAFLSIGEGFRRTVESAGSSDLAMITRDDSLGATSSAIGPDELARLSTAPGIARTSDSDPILSPEITLPISVPTKQGSEANLTLRGLNLGSPLAKAGISLLAGRMARPGTSEVVAGRSAASEFGGIDLGSEVDLGGHAWKVVGIFASNGSAYESEVRADLSIVQSLFRRGQTAQTVRAKLADDGALARLRQYLKSNPELRLQAETERDYFLRAARSGAFIQMLGWPLALIMAVGALCGAANTMSSSTASRAPEIGTLRAIGFRRLPIFAGIMVESLALALAGALLGVLIAWLIFDGVSGSTLGSSLGQIVFKYRMSPALAAQAVGLALLIGAIGGAGPAWRAARRPLHDIAGE